MRSAFLSFVVGFVRAGAVMRERDGYPRFMMHMLAPSNKAIPAFSSTKTKHIKVKC